MVKCSFCGKYSIREYNIWLKRKRYGEKDLCYGCDSKEEKVASDMIDSFRDKPVTDKHYGKHLEKLKSISYQRCSGRDGYISRREYVKDPPGNLKILKDISNLFQSGRWKDELKKSKKKK